MIKQAKIDMSKKDPMTEIKHSEDGTYWCAVEGVFSSGTDGLDEFSRFVFSEFVADQDCHTLQFVGRVHMRPLTLEELKEKGYDEGYWQMCKESHPEAVEMWEIQEIERTSESDEKEAESDTGILLAAGCAFYFMKHENNEEEGDITVIYDEDDKEVCRFIGHISRQQAISQCLEELS